MDDLHCTLKTQTNKYPEYLEGLHDVLSNHFAS